MREGGRQGEQKPGRMEAGREGESSDWTPSLGTTICPGCSPKKTKKKEKKKKKAEPGRSFMKLNVYQDN